MVRDQLAFFVVQRANLGRRHAVGRPVQQARAKLFFKMRHQLGGRRLAHAHVGGRLAKGAQVHDADKKFDGL